VDPVKPTCCDTQSGEEVVNDRPDSSLELQRHPEGLDAPVQRNADDEEHIQPVDMLVPVVPRESSVGDMDFLDLTSARPGSVCGLRRHDAGVLYIQGLQQDTGIRQGEEESTEMGCPLDKWKEGLSLGGGEEKII
jgi:hypothetical protein